MTKQLLDIKSIYAPIAGELKRVEDALQHELRSGEEFVQALLDHIAQFRGKYLRPALALLAGRACGALRRDHVQLALVCEMIHLATLVHDDVIDGAEIRRQVPCVNKKWTNETAVLLGDFLFSHAFHLSTGFETVTAARELSKTTNIMVAGELLQVRWRNRFELSEEEYLRVIGMKTAELTACSAYLGAVYAGAEAPQARALYKYGYDLGLAFQIIDDYLDLTGEESRMGKTLGTDLGMGRATLPVIRLLQAAKAQEKPALLALLADGARSRKASDELRERMADSGALQYTLATAQRLVKSAVDALAPLPASAVKDHLAELAEFVTARQH